MCALAMVGNGYLQCSTVLLSAVIIWATIERHGWLYKVAVYIYIIYSRDKIMMLIILSIIIVTEFAETIQLHTLKL